LKTIIHDEKNHLATIKSLSDNKETNDYIDRLCGEIKVSSLFGNTENKMLDLVLNKYSYICENDDIRFNVTVKTANLTFIENTDLVTVMSNMLDNAVEAAKVSAEKYIDLSINRTNGFDIITCTNSCDKKPQSIGKMLKTTKTDDGLHGLGVNSIRRIVKKYNGDFEWSYDENSKEFVVYIAFKD
ncbi:MAG: sensor histidine kinase, partial [Clostridia bacterium]|nr:sensor histidine kinase [Clostridia bacterium]